MPQIKLTTPQFFSDVYYWKWDYPSILKADLQAIDDQKNRTSFVDVPEHLGKIICFYFNASHNVLCLKQSDVRILEEFELHLWQEFRSKK